MLALLEKHWRAVTVALLGLVVLGHAAYLHHVIARLEDRNSRAIEIITQQDRDRAQAMQDQFTRVIGAYQETVRILSQAPRGTTIERTTERVPVVVPPPAGSPAGTAPTAASGKPGTPLIPADQAPAARRSATERIVAHVDPGHLVNCPPYPDQLEFLRDPQGRLLSTATCISAIDDTVRLPAAPTSNAATESPRLKVVGGIGNSAGSTTGGLAGGAGLAYELARISILHFQFTGDLAALVTRDLSGHQGIAVGPGLSYALTDRLTIGPYFLVGNPTGPWILAGYRL